MPVLREQINRNEINGDGLHSPVHDYLLHGEVKVYEVPRKSYEKNSSGAGLWPVRILPNEDFQDERKWDFLED